MRVAKLRRWGAKAINNVVGESYLNGMRGLGCTKPQGCTLTHGAKFQPLSNPNQGITRTREHVIQSKGTCSRDTPNYLYSQSQPCIEESESFQRLQPSHLLEPLHHSFRNHPKSLRVPTPRLRNYSRFPPIRILTDPFMKRDVAQEMQLMLFAGLSRARRPKDAGLVMTLRADECRHILDHPQYLLIVSDSLRQGKKRLHGEHTLISIF